MKQNRSISVQDLAKGIDPEPEVRSLRDENMRLHTLIASMKKQTGELSRYFDAVIAEVKHVPAVEIEKVFPKTDKVSSEITAVLQFTDWHTGLVVEPDEIESFNAFSPEIQKARLSTLVQKVVDWVQNMRSTYNIKKLWIPVTGDMISGDIHEELRVTNAWPTPVQAVHAGTLLADCVAKLSQCFETVEVDFVVPDNHGRLSKKPQSAQEGMNSHNYVVGAFAKERLRDFKDVKFNVREAHSVVVKVAGRRYLLIHGHGIQGWGGIPFYGIERRAGKEAMTRMPLNVGVHFDKIIMGHLHTAVDMPWYSIGPSLSGTDAHDHKNGRRGEPGQVAWMIHPRWGEFNRTVFSLKEV